MREATDKLSAQVFTAWEAGFPCFDAVILLRLKHRLSGMQTQQDESWNLDKACGQLGSTLMIRARSKIPLSQGEVPPPATRGFRRERYRVMVPKYTSAGRVEHYIAHCV
jgi:hypothetical protein